MAPYYPVIAVEGALPNGTTGDVAVTTDTYKLFANVSGNWYENGQAVATVALSGTVTKGDLIGYSSGWQRAANTAGSVIPASFIALKSGVSGDTIPVARRGVITGSFTAGVPVYLSTAGAITTTRPTTSASLRQQVGLSISTTQVLVDIKGAREVLVPLVIAETTSGEAAFGSMVALDSGTFEGIQLNANAEYITFNCQLPENITSVVKSLVRVAAESADAEVAVTVNSACPGDAGWDTITADTSVTADTLTAFTASDPVTNYDLVAQGALDAASIIRPGAMLTIKFVHSNDTDAILFFPGSCLVVRVAE